MMAGQSNTEDSHPAHLSDELQHVDERPNFCNDCVAQKKHRDRTRDSKIIAGKEVRMMRPSQQRYCQCRYTEKLHVVVAHGRHATQIWRAQAVYCVMPATQADLVSVKVLVCFQFYHR